MMRGNISNQVASCNIGVRLNDFLVVTKRMNLLERCWHTLGGQVRQSAIDVAVARFVEMLYYRTDMTVDLVVVGESKYKYIEIVRDVPHNTVHSVENHYAVETLLAKGVLTYFVGAQMDVLRINGSHAFTMDKFGRMLNKRWQHHG